MSMWDPPTNNTPRFFPMLNFLIYSPTGVALTHKKKRVEKCNKNGSSIRCQEFQSRTQRQGMAGIPEFYMLWKF